MVRILVAVSRYKRATNVLRGKNHSMALLHPNTHFMGIPPLPHHHLHNLPRIEVGMDDEIQLMMGRLRQSIHSMDIPPLLHLNNNLNPISPIIDGEIQLMILVVPLPPNIRSMDLRRPPIILNHISNNLRVNHDSLADEILLVQSQSKAYIPDRCRIQSIIKCQFVMVSMMVVHNHIIIIANNSSNTTHTVRKITVGLNHFQ